jgi:uncharacterized protein (DUF952 family)
MPESRPKYIYKVTKARLWQEAGQTGYLKGMPVDEADGFMHFSTAEQLPETLSRHFAGQSDLVLLAVRTADIEIFLKWEPSRGGALFPHLYGELPHAAVEWDAEISVGKDGSAELPPGIE